MFFADFILSDQDVGAWMDVAKDMLNLASRLLARRGNHQKADVVQLRLLEVERHCHQRVGCNCSRQDIETEEKWRARNTHLVVPERKQECNKTAPYHCQSNLYQATHLRVVYYAFCRGDDITKYGDKYQGTPNKGTVCRYNNRNDARLLIAPLKMEEIHTEGPVMFKIYDILNEKEIELLKELGKPVLRTAVIAENNSTSFSEKRIGETGAIRIEDQNSPEVMKILNRIQTAFGVDFRYSEGFRISNYPTSGYFYVHKDYRENNTLADDNRIATILIYFNESDGGETVFPYLNIKIKPEKGTAFIFYNMKKNGREETLSAHGSCPILTGSKWIATQFVSRYGQEFSHPCDLDSSK